MAKEKESELVRAAGTLDAEIARFDDVALALEKLDLGSQKGLEKAARLLKTIGDVNESLDGAMKGLIVALDHARQRQQSRATSVQQRAKELTERVGDFERLMQRYIAIGASASAITGRVRDLAAVAGSDKEAFSAGAKEIVAGMNQVQGEARTLEADAKSAGFADVARQAETLEKQLTAARSKLEDLEKRMP